jgi:hypothetical protein
MPSAGRGSVSVSGGADTSERADVVVRSAGTGRGRVGGDDVGVDEAVPCQTAWRIFVHGASRRVGAPLGVSALGVGDGCACWPWLVPADVVLEADVRVIVPDGQEDVA